MININIIVAYCKNYGIGMDNSLPWKISSDLQKFRKLTIGNKNNCIIMGKNTWLSLDSKPLKNRDNLILTTSLKINITNNNISKSFKNIDELYNFLEKKNYDNIWIIGGESIYKLFLNNSLFNVDYIYVTYIEENITCDTFFPKLENNKYNFFSKSIHNYDISNNIYDIIYKNKNLIYKDSNNCNLEI